MQLVWTAVYQAPLSMKFPRQKYWSGLPFLFLEDLPDPGTEPSCTVSSALQVNSLPLSHQGIPVYSMLLLLLSRFSRVRLCVTQRRHPTRLPPPWDSPGKNTGVGCHFLLQCMKVKSESEVVQSCPTPSDPIDCSPPGSSIHGTGTLQARVLEWVAIVSDQDRKSVV